MTGQNTPSVDIGVPIGAVIATVGVYGDVHGPRLLSTSKGKRRSVQSRDFREISPEEVERVIIAANSRRDELLIRSAWVTGGRISEVLALTPRGIEAHALVIPNRKNPSKPIKRVFLPGESAVPGQLLLWVRDMHVREDDPLFFSTWAGKRQQLTRSQAWNIIRDASDRAGVLVRSIRQSKKYGPIGSLVPIWPHVLRHSRARQIMRHSNNNLGLVMEQLGHARPQMTYLNPGDQERRELMAGVPA